MTSHDRPDTHARGRSFEREDIEAVGVLFLF